MRSARAGSRVACTARPKGGPAGGREPNRARDEWVSAGGTNERIGWGGVWLTFAGRDRLPVQPTGIAIPSSRQESPSRPADRNRHPVQPTGIAIPSSRQGGNERGRLARRARTTQGPQRSEDRSEARPPSEPGAFKAVAVAVLCRCEPGAFEALLLVPVSSGIEPGAFRAVRKQLLRYSKQLRHPK